MSGAPGVRRRIERSLMSLMAPMVGARAAGDATVAATGADTLVPRNAYAVPVIASAAGQLFADASRLFKVAADTTVTSAGDPVPMISVVGGANHNVAAGAGLIWDPPIPGIESRSVLAAGATGGTDVPGDGQLVRVLRFEGAPADIWKATGSGGFPCGVIAWQADRKHETVGRGREIREYDFRIYIITTRFDSHPERQDEGKAALDVLEEIFCDRAAADGYIFSTTPVQLGDGGRVAFSPTSLVYYLDLKVRHTVLKRELRTFVDWTQSREQFTTTPPDPSLNPQTLIVVDQVHDD